MKEFNYEDYLKYTKLKIKEMNGIIQLRESEEKYHVHQPHDKILKTVLEEKSQVIGLLNRILKIDLKEGQIEKYENKYIYV